MTIEFQTNNNESYRLILLYQPNFYNKLYIEQSQDKHKKCLKSKINNNESMSTSTYLGNIHNLG